MYTPRFHTLDDLDNFLIPRLDKDCTSGRNNPFRHSLHSWRKGLFLPSVQSLSNLGIKKLISDIQCFFPAEPKKNTGMKTSVCNSYYLTPQSPPFIVRSMKKKSLNHQSLISQYLWTWSIFRKTSSNKLEGNLDSQIHLDSEYHFLLLFNGIP